MTVTMLLHLSHLFCIQWLSFCFGCVVLLVGRIMSLCGTLCTCTYLHVSFLGQHNFIQPVNAQLKLVLIYFNLKQTIVSLPYIVLTTYMYTCIQYEPIGFSFNCLSHMIAISSCSMCFKMFLTLYLALLTCSVWYKIITIIC